MSNVLKVCLQASAMLIFGSSGGKIVSSKTRDVRCRLTRLAHTGTTLYRSHSALGDYFRRLGGKLGSPGAITAAAAHKLVRILFTIYHVP